MQYQCYRHHPKKINQTPEPISSESRDSIGRCNSGTPSNIQRRRSLKDKVLEEKSPPSTEEAPHLFTRKFGQLMKTMKIKTGKVQSSKVQPIDSPLQQFPPLKTATQSENKRRNSCFSSISSSQQWGGSVEESLRPSSSSSSRMNGMNEPLQSNRSSASYIRHGGKLQSLPFSEEDKFKSLPRPTISRNPSATFDSESLRTFPRNMSTHTTYDNESLSRTFPRNLSTAYDSDSSEEVLLTTATAINYNYERTDSSTNINFRESLPVISPIKKTNEGNPIDPVSLFFQKNQEQQKQTSPQKQLIHSSEIFRKLKSRLATARHSLYHADHMAINKFQIVTMKVIRLLRGAAAFKRALGIHSIDKLQHEEDMANYWMNLNNTNELVMFESPKHKWSDNDWKFLTNLIRKFPKWRLHFESQFGDVESIAKDIVNYFEFEEHSPGKILLKEGHRPVAFYLLYQGKVSESASRLISSNFCQDGDILGFEGVDQNCSRLENFYRMRTVTCESKCKFFKIYFDEYSKFFKHINGDLLDHQSSSKSNNHDNNPSNSRVQGENYSRSETCLLAKPTFEDISDKKIVTEAFSFKCSLMFAMSYVKGTLEIVGKKELSFSPQPEVDIELNKFNEHIIIYVKQNTLKRREWRLDSLKEMFFNKTATRKLTLELNFSNSDRCLV